MHLFSSSAPQEQSKVSLLTDVGMTRKMGIGKPPIHPIAPMTTSSILFISQRPIFDQH